MRKKVLVVDDDPAVRDTLREVLEQSGWDVATAADGAEALRHLGRHSPPRAILVDLMMPVMDGWQLLQTLKRDPSLARIPAIAMSAGGSRTLATAPVCRDYLAKPMSVDRLLEALEHCDRPPPLAA